MRRDGGIFSAEGVDESTLTDWCEEREMYREWTNSLTPVLNAS